MPAAGAELKRAKLAAVRADRPALAAALSCLETLGGSHAQRGIVDQTRELLRLPS